MTRAAQSWTTSGSETVGFHLFFCHFWKSMNYGGKPLLIIFWGVYSNLSDPRAIWRGFHMRHGKSSLPNRPIHMSLKLE